MDVRIFRRRPVVVFALAFAALEIIEAHFRRYTLDGVHFANWTSETLMQSVSLRDLAAEPFSSLWYLHIQPPISNLIRDVLAVFHPHASGMDLVRVVDRDLYHVWAIAAAALTALVDRWLCALRVNAWVAALLTAGWFIDPANLEYAALVDGTLLSAALTAWLLHETWRLADNPDRSPRPLIAAVLLAYFTRSIYQWPFMLVMAASLVLLRVPRRTIVTFAAVVGLVVGLYSVKQAWLFGTVSTSTFAGTNLSRSIGADCGQARPIAPARVTAAPAAVLTKPTMLDGSVNWNQRDHLAIERGLSACFRSQLAARSLSSLWAEYRTNIVLYFLPSSNYVPHEIADRLPWRRTYDRVFSGNRLLWSVIVAGVLALARSRRRWRAALAVALPFAYVLVACIVGERGENNRFKFFLQPAVYVLLASQVYWLGYRGARWVIVAVARRAAAPRSRPAPASSRPLPG